MPAMPPMRLLSYSARALPAGLAAQVAAIEARAWPGSAPGHDPALRPRVLLLVDGAGTVGACLALLHKEIPCAGRGRRAAGLSAVVTRPELRGRGLGGRLVAGARAALAADPAVDLALFSCDRPLAPFYEAAGFERLPGTVLVGGTPAEPLATDAPGFDKEVLAAFFAPDPEGAADRAALAGTRVPLHPGAVDRLW
ncbi:GNAT family N-acetyltransferase [Streptomyces sp. NPDC059982]|uniref:GNAT family N-acetyltransferase n=1 Tax=unclassified Streptomyces TaxID=2593676 RepID=UPI0036C0B5A9